MARTSDLEQSFAFMAKAAKVPAFDTEYRFCETRKWRFDFAWPEHKVAFEVEGGIWTDGRHTRGAAFNADCEKYNVAALLGWRVFRVTETHLENGQAFTWLRQCFGVERLQYAEREQQASEETPPVVGTET